MILFSNYSKKRNFDFCKIDNFIAYFHLIVYKKVLLIDIFYPLPNSFACDRRCVIKPLLYSKKVLNKLFIIDVLHQVKVLIYSLLKWLQCCIARIKLLRG